MGTIDFNNVNNFHQSGGGKVESTYLSSNIPEKIGITKLEVSSQEINFAAKRRLDLTEIQDYRDFVILLVDMNNIHNGSWFFGRILIWRDTGAYYPVMMDVSISHLWGQDNAKCDVNTITKNYNRAPLCRFTYKGNKWLGIRFGDNSYPRISIFVDDSSNINQIKRINYFNRETGGTMNTEIKDSLVDIVIE